VCLVGVAVFSTVIAFCICRWRSQALSPEPLVLVPGGDPQALTMKPRGDTRSYQISLLPNGLQMVNVRDESATKSAFGVAVQAGSYDDPEQFPGLAHFCEHMLFLGTERFPEATGFNDFMSKHDGSNNAYTSDETTVYFAEVSSKAAPEGVSRLADFFRAPLFDKHYVKKEVLAINSEHTKNIPDPGRRIFETLNSIANPLSPVSKFHTGNLNTLYEAPQKRGEDPVDALRVYFATHYCPSKMRLVTIGPEPLEKQFSTAGTAFGQIQEGTEGCAKHPRRTFADPAPWPTDRLGKWVGIQGTQPQPQLWFMFPLPDLRKEYKSQPFAYIRWVLRYSGENSLVRVLQDVLGLVTNFGIGLDSGSSGSSLICTATLTQAGKKNPEAVLDVFYAYIATLLQRGVDEALYRSLGTVARLEWDWSEPDDPMGTVADLAETLTRLPSDRLLSGDYLIESPNTTLVASLLKMITPANMLTVFVDPDVNKESEKAEMQELPHYGVKYAVRDLSVVLPGATARWLSWLSDKAPDEGSLAKNLSSQLSSARLLKQGVAVMPLPEPPRPIEGVPTEISMDNMVAHRTSGTSSAEEAMYGQRPVDLHQQEEVGATLLSRKRGSADPQVFYRQGWVTTSPKVQLMATFRPLRVPSEPESSVEEKLRLLLFQRLLLEEMGPRMVDLAAAGASYDIQTDSSALVLAFGGYAEMLPQVVNKVLAELARGVNVSDAARFNRVIAEIKENLATYSQMPISYAIADRNLLLTRGSSSREEQLTALQQVTADSSAAALDDLLFTRHLRLSALAMGNFAREDVHKTVKVVAAGVRGPQGEPAAQAQVELITPIVKLTRPVELRKKNPRNGDHDDAVVVTFIAGVTDVAMRVVFGLLGQILNPIAENELRTNMQLGYVVNSGVVSLSNVQGLSVVVQGNKSKADLMEAAVMRVYTKLLPERLQNLTDDEFASYKHSFSQSILQPPLGFSDEYDHFWGPVAQGGQCFELQDEMLKYLKETVKSKDVLIEAYNRLLFPDSGHRKKLVVKYFAGDTPSHRPTLQQAVKNWKEQEVPEKAIKQLSDEYKQLSDDWGKTLILDKADSEVRARLLKEGGYYSTDLNCGGPSKKKDASESSSPARARQSLTETNVKATILSDGHIARTAFRKGVAVKPRSSDDAAGAAATAISLSAVSAREPGISLFQTKERSIALKPRGESENRKLEAQQLLRTGYSGRAASWRFPASPTIRFRKS